MKKGKRKGYTQPPHRWVRLSTTTETATILFNQQPERLAYNAADAQEQHHELRRKKSALDHRHVKTYQTVQSPDRFISHETPLLNFDLSGSNSLAIAACERSDVTLWSVPLTYGDTLSTSW